MGNGVLSVKRAIALIGAAAVSAPLWVGCGLQYASEEFSLQIGKDGSGELSVLYRNFGSKETKNQLRKKDLDTLRRAAMDDQIVIDAREKGVALKNRRLDFVNYQQDGYVEATAAAYKDLFKVFTHYKLEVEDMIYIMPQNGTVSRAELSKPGKIIIRNNRYVFAWPLTATDISFHASYKLKGASFQYEFQKKYRRK